MIIPNPAFETAKYRLVYLDDKGNELLTQLPEQRFTEPPPADWNDPSVFSAYRKRCEVFPFIKKV